MGIVNRIGHVAYYACARRASGSRLVARCSLSLQLHAHLFHLALSRFPSLPIRVALYRPPLFLPSEGSLKVAAWSARTLFGNRWTSAEMKTRIF
eukprot:9455803-Pyramimonas_sp.AAC.1